MAVSRASVGICPVRRWVTTVAMGRLAVNRGMMELASGAALEADIHIRPGCSSGVGVMIAHPYSYLGGSMLDPVVTELFR